jgi:phosphoribosylanthranilate isomerase
MNRPLVKVCGLTRPENAREVARLGADYLGTIFYAKSPRCVNEDSLSALLSEMPAGKRVMVDVAPTPDTLRRRREAGFDYFQIHFDINTTTRAQVEGWMNAVGRERLWLAPKLRPEAEMPDYVFELAHTLVIDTFSPGAFGGTGKTGEWGRFARLHARKPSLRMALAGGLGPDNIEDAVRKTGAPMVDLNSGVEISPGIKDSAKVARVMEILRGIHA